jgi:phospholipid/cholesterol/gamma-HCH transport system substrate-binding protein
MLNRVSSIRFEVALDASMMPAYGGSRANFMLGIWPNSTRYYLLGLGSDPRGRLSNLTTQTTTTVAGVSQTVVTHTQTSDVTSLLWTAMLGKVFWSRLDLAVGLLYGDGVLRTKLLLGPDCHENLFELRNDVYVRTSAAGVDARLLLTYRPFESVYFMAGLESFRGPSGHGKPAFTYGLGVNFNDDDIKLLFALR